MTCHHCTDARVDPVRPYFGVGCVSCRARALAVTGDRASLAADPLPADQAEIMRRLFGATWADSLGPVRWWLSRIRQHEASKEASA